MKRPKKLKCIGSVWGFCFTVFIRFVKNCQKSKETGFEPLLSRRGREGESVLTLFYILLLPQSLLSSQRGLSQQMAVCMLMLNEPVVSSSMKQATEIPDQMATAGMS